MPKNKQWATAMMTVMYSMGCHDERFGINVKYPYRAVQTATHDNTNLKIVRLTFHRNTTRPAKNRNSEMWRSVGNVSTAHGRRHFSTPSAKNA
jgi:hypothetical protein